MKITHSVSAFILLAHITEGQNNQFVVGPEDKSPVTYATWLPAYLSWRDEISFSLNLTNYNLAEVAWARTSFIQPQVMLHDRFLYNRDSNTWTVGKYLEDVRRRYGGVDSVLLWASYPNIGVDDRNQFDMTESLPGGLEGLAQVVRDFHSEGVNVLLPYNPWDQYTRNSGVEDYRTLIQQIVATSSDGFNGDTMDGVNKTFWDEGIINSHPIVMEPEGLRSNWSYLEYNMLSWGYWTPGAKGLTIIPGNDLANGKRRSSTILPPPLISSYKAVTNGRHLTHVCERWADNHMDGIQQAFFNGIGFESWENVWGLWNGLTERDSESLRRVGFILRQFPNLFQYPGEYYPHVPIFNNLDSAVFASMFFYHNTDMGYSEKIWTLVNRDQEIYEVDIIQLPCDDMIGFGKALVLDIYSGQVLDTECVDGNVLIELEIEPGGFASFLLSTSSTAADDLSDFLAKMADMSSKPLSSFSSDWIPLQQELDTPYPVFSATFTPDAGMVLVPGTSQPFDFVSHGTAIEGDRLPSGVDVQFPWEDFPRRIHKTSLTIPDLYVDRFPVTNADFLNFLSISNWAPQDITNWLVHWDDNDTYPQGWGKKPVTWVSPQDSQAYCSFYGKRLPHSYEWQWFGQGTNGSGWPWGSNDTVDFSKIPEFTSGRDQPPPDDVDAHPDGASWAGIEDMVGNIYQWTADIFTDSHTSRAVLRGSPRWRPMGENSRQSWYFPLPWGEHWYPIGSNWHMWKTPGPLYEHSTLLLLSEGMDRSGGIGFRCVAETESV